MSILSAAIFICRRATSAPDSVLRTEYDPDLQSCYATDSGPTIDLLFACLTPHSVIGLSLQIRLCAVVSTHS